MNGLPIQTTALSTYELGDKRLNKRLGIICKQLHESVGTSTPVTIHNRGQTKAYYRFINNKKVMPTALIEGYGLYSQKQTHDIQVLLSIQDTTSLNYSTKKSAPQLDCLESEKDKGFMLHNHMLLDGRGTPIGLFSQRFFARKAEDLGRDKDTKRKKTPFAKKESYRWLAEFEALQEAYKTDTDKLIIQICDREADIHEVLQARKVGHVHYLIRNAYERADATRGNKSIWKQIDELPFFYEYSLAIPDGKNRTARTATMQVRYKKVTIKAGYRKDKSLKAQELWILETKEVTPVPAGEEPVHWRLLTSLAITTPEIAAQIIQYYILRWTIERFHFVLKQGLNTEQLQVKTKIALQNAIILKSWQALAVMVLAYTPKTAPQMRLLESKFTQEDYDLAYLYAKQHCNTKEKYQKDPLLLDFIRLIAQIGGHSLQAKKPIGIVSIWRGWNTFCIIRNVAKTMNDNKKNSIDVNDG
jgi:Transposase DNA-binding/Transposase DDE domain